ncbi:hypothetical protein SNK04_014087 [Fusarium graminearum]
MGWHPGPSGSPQRSCGGAWAFVEGLGSRFTGGTCGGGLGLRKDVLRVFRCQPLGLLLSSDARTLLAQVASRVADCCLGDAQRVRVLGVLASQQAGGVRILALLPHGLAPRDLVRLGFGHNPTRLGQHCTRLRVDSDRLSNGVRIAMAISRSAGTIGRAVITRCREGFIDGCQDAHALLAVSLDGVQQKQLVMVHRRQRVHHIRHVERGDGAQFCSQCFVGATAAGIGDRSGRVGRGIGRGDGLAGDAGLEFGRGHDWLQH